jgi:hypothetical protein
MEVTLNYSVKKWWKLQWNQRKLSIYKF